MADKQKFVDNVRQVHNILVSEFNVLMYNEHPLGKHHTIQY